MNKQEAREWIKTIATLQKYDAYPAIHPQFARDLYTTAEWEIPEHLKPRPPLDPAILYALERSIFGKE